MKSILTKFQLGCKEFKMSASTNDSWVSRCVGWLILAVAIAILIRAVAPNGLI